MSEANTDPVGEQGKFGPPPVDVFTVSAGRSPAGRWTLAISTRRSGSAFSRDLTEEGLTTADLIEAVVTWTYHLLLKA